MGDRMTFPATFDEFAEQYKIVDKQEIYTNGTGLIPIFRAKQWLENADVVPRAEVAREIFQEIYADLFRMLPLKVFHLMSGDIVGDRFDAGKERALHDVIHCVAEIEKKYTEVQK